MENTLLHKAFSDTRGRVSLHSNYHSLFDTLSGRHCLPPFFCLAAAVIVAATAAAVAVIGAQQTVVAAATEQDQQDDDPPAAVITHTIVTHKNTSDFIISG